MRTSVEVSRNKKGDYTIRRSSKVKKDRRAEFDNVIGVSKSASFITEFNRLNAYPVGAIPALDDNNEIPETAHCVGKSAAREEGPRSSSDTG